MSDYLGRVTEMFFKNRDLIQGFVEPQIRHDDDCPMLNGGDVCECVPDIDIELNGKVYDLDSDNKLILREAK